MKNLKGISIIDLIEMSADDHDGEVFDIIKKTTDYDKCNEVIGDVLDYLLENNKEYWSALDNAASAIEGIIKDVAFEQGFKTAIKLIFSSLS
jgi:hypothetical protein